MFFLTQGTHIISVFTGKHCGARSHLLLSDCGTHGYCQLENIHCPCSALNVLEEVLELFQTDQPNEQTSDSSSQRQL